MSGETFCLLISVGSENNLFIFFSEFVVTCSFFSRRQSHKYRVLIPVESCLIKREADQAQSVCFLVFQQKLAKLGKFGFKRKLQGAVIGPAGCRCYLHIEKRKVKLCCFKYSYSTIPGVF